MLGVSHYHHNYYYYFKWIALTDREISCPLEYLNIGKAHTARDVIKVFQV